MPVIASIFTIASGAVIIGWRSEVGGGSAPPVELVCPSIKLGIGFVGRDAATVVTAADDAIELVVDDDVAGSEMLVDVEVVVFATFFMFFSMRCFEGVSNFDPVGSVSTLEGIEAAAAGIGAAAAAVLVVDDDVVAGVGVEEALMAEVTGGRLGVCTDACADV